MYQAKHCLWPQECFVPVNLEDVTSVVSRLMVLRRAVPCVLSSWWPEDRAAVLRSSHPGLGARVPGWESGSDTCQLCFIRQLSPPLWTLIFSYAKWGKCFLVRWAVIRIKWHDCWADVRCTDVRLCTFPRCFLLCTTPNMHPSRRPWRELVLDPCTLLDGTEQGSPKWGPLAGSSSCTWQHVRNVNSQTHWSRSTACGGSAVFYLQVVLVNLLHRWDLVSAF